MPFIIFPKNRAWLRRIVLTVSVLLALVCAYLIGLAPSAIREASKHPERIQTIEGVVSNYERLAKGEKFCVEATCFQYYDYVITGGFNNTAAFGGPIKNGLPVRILFIRTDFKGNSNMANIILRLEASEGPPGAA